MSEANPEITSSLGRPREGSKKSVVNGLGRAGYGVNEF